MRDLLTLYSLASFCPSFSFGLASVYFPCSWSVWSLCCCVIILVSEPVLFCSGCPAEMPQVGRPETAAVYFWALEAQKCKSGWLWLWPLMRPSFCSQERGLLQPLLGCTDGTNPAHEGSAPQLHGSLNAVPPTMAVMELRALSIVLSSGISTCFFFNLESLFYSFKFLLKRWSGFYFWRRWTWWLVPWPCRNLELVLLSIVSILCPYWSWYLRREYLEIILTAGILRTSHITINYPFKANTIPWSLWVSTLHGPGQWFCNGRCSSCH